MTAKSEGYDLEEFCPGAEFDLYNLGPSLVGGTMELCQGPRVSKGPHAPAADCCKRRNLVS